MFTLEKKIVCRTSADVLSPPSPSPSVRKRYVKSAAVANREGRLVRFSIIKRENKYGNDAARRDALRCVALHCIALRCVLICTRTRNTPYSKWRNSTCNLGIRVPADSIRRPAKRVASSLILLPSDHPIPGCRNFFADNSATRSSPISNINRVKNLRHRPIYPNSCLCSRHSLKRSYAAEIRLGQPGTRARIVAEYGALIFFFFQLCVSRAIC